MAILKKTYDKMVGALKVLLGSAVVVGLRDTLGGIIKEKGVEAGGDFIKSLATGKGLQNEAVYGFILGKCDLTTSERSLLIRAIEGLRTGTEENRQAANNFIILVALGDPDKETGERPGERIVHGFIHRINEYKSEDEKVRMIKDNIIHIGTDAETKKKIAVVQKWAIGAWNEIKKFVGQINAVSADFRQNSETALNEFRSLPWWKKMAFGHSPKPNKKEE
ncbi:MAG: hypothetical protein COZ85_03880 [Candidatus Moranbacteria bacterium CG_4_8_14_3_um_filter_34_16]|nr:MAG: hypothetical protein COT31_04485 [Candidatus Moranbacteria bacterium CG08_land_8_20_14_0_20_34_16]PIW94683.1 MAG: hypothetical protein COZ85_03880 [Candidatus Moranbacteria bacterium CG_4_8_14_3_um_filter_34_16]